MPKGGPLGWSQSLAMVLGSVSTLSPAACSRRAFFAVPPPPITFRDSIAAGAYEEAGIGPEDMSMAEVYDLSSALELDWYENIGLCKPGGAEKLLNVDNLYDPANIALMHHLYAALRAHALYHRDQHYVVQNGEVIIVDEFTGRLMSGRRWSDGLHQAVEAKEGVPIQRENQTLASITFQNYFRMYGKLAGMTGTADTEAFEFQQIYHLETVVIPTHQPMVRKDENDQVYRTFDEKVDAVLADIRDCHARGQPVLVGTTSIENSELLSKRLDKEKLPHQVLNAKQHAREAEIVAQAGRSGMITIATNMAGRGTDIVLGGSIEPLILKFREDETVAPEEKEARTATMRAARQERPQHRLQSRDRLVVVELRAAARRRDELVHPLEAAVEHLHRVRAHARVHHALPRVDVVVRGQLALLPLERRVVGEVDARLDADRPRAPVGRDLRQRGRGVRHQPVRAREVVVGEERLEDRALHVPRVQVGGRLRIEAGLGDRERHPQHLARIGPLLGRRRCGGADGRGDDGRGERERTPRARASHRRRSQVHCALPVALRRFESTSKYGHGCWSNALYL